ncbi:hypothetical protein Q7P37_006015 [Cladosporium fusiforme]
MAASLEADELRRVYHHVFLPPQLPQESDEESAINSDLLRITLDALKQLPDSSPPATTRAITAMENLRDINSLPQTAVSEKDLCRILTTLADGQSAPVHIGCQNAAVLATRNKHTLVFEAFEFSPRNAQVLSTKGRLIRHFPGVTIAIDARQNECPPPVSVIAHTLSTMSSEYVARMQPQSYKAGMKHEEHRDTGDPALATELFMAFLRGFGRPCPTGGVSKNTRDEVLWLKADSPWRRSSMWLMIRVVLQLVFKRLPGGGDTLFKKTMVFIMSTILESAVKLSFPNDALYSMSAKIDRRLHKLHAAAVGSSDQEGIWLSQTHGILQSTSTTISGRWKTIQAKDGRDLDLDALSRLKVRQDTYFILPALDRYISSLKSRSQGKVSRPFIPSSLLLEPEATSLPPLPDKNPSEFHYATANLQQFELWIANNLESWLKHQSKILSKSCYKLHVLMKQYHGLASRHYSGNPEGISVMFLTLFDLWIAIDKLALQTCPMLGEYSPDIPQDVLQSLLLPFPYQMKRLSDVESHLKERKECRIYSSNRLFSMADSSNFAIRYFEESDRHKELKKKIEEEAQRSSDAKRTEYDTKSMEYDQLDALISEADCDYVEKHDMRYNPPQIDHVHDRKCQKCSWRKQRDNIRITIHEWPLPENPDLAKTVVFELRVPLWYASWRDARQYLLQQVLNGHRERTALIARFQPSNDPNLRSWYSPGAEHQRIGLLSERKPLAVTHYKTKKIAEVDIESVCVPNGLHYQYFDEVSDQYIGPLDFDDQLSKACMYKLPEPGLQRFIFRPASNPDGEQPNVVIANQSKCPDAMSLDEYKELSSVPLGHHVQWVNILQQLAMPGVDFKKFVTTLVFLQCIYQTGPPGEDYLREAHTMLRNTGKVLDLLAQLDAAVDRVKQNWESAQALSLFTTIATRIFFLNKSTTYGACLSLLAKIRTVCFGWMNTLRDAAHQTSSNESREMFSARSVEAAMICISTYDVPKQYVEEIWSSTQQVSMIVQAAVAFQQSGTPKVWEDESLQLLRLRVLRFFHRFYKSLMEYTDGIDDAVKHSWSPYTPSDHGWATVSESVDDWITTQTIIPSGRKMHVHYNVLSGELLVNGVPLDQPPQEYRAKPLYETLFAKAMVEVMPATKTGFRFSSKRTFGDHKVELGLSTSPTTGMHSLELVVQGDHPTGLVETVPSRVFGQDFPTHFLQEYVHWYNFRTGNVEFRPSEDPWNHASPLTWILRKVASNTGDTKWRLLKDGDAVVGLHTPTARAISSILKPIADPARIHCVFQSTNQVLQVDVPAHDLSFFLDKGDSLLKSKEFRTMAIDKNQGLGTLIGFTHKLMLKSSSGGRMLLLPEADVTCTQARRHVVARLVGTASIRKIHAIHVDTKLDRLVDSGDIGCKIYLAYLHALTSFCLTDPLTHMTGTEQALTILRSCAVRSFSQLSQENVYMLSSIAGLSPGRCYYPPGKFVMQTVTWNSKVSFMAQHAGLRLAVQEIFQQSRDASVFYPEIRLSFPTLKQCEKHLQERDSIRSSTFRVSGFGAEDHTSQHDRLYSPRDQGVASPRGTNVSRISALMARPTPDKHWQLPSLTQLWLKLREMTTIQGPDISMRGEKYCYAGRWTDSKSLQYILEKLPGHFRRLANLLTLEDRAFAAVWLATLAFADNANMEILQVFAMIAKRQGLLTTPIPSAHSFTLTEGFGRTRDPIFEVVKSHMRAFEVCPEYVIAPEADETPEVHLKRRLKRWGSVRYSVLDRVVAELVAQWDLPVPHTPRTDDATVYINMQSAMDVITRKFQVWHDNRQLQQYLRDTLQRLGHFGTENIPLPALLFPGATQRVNFPGYVAVRDLFSTPAPTISKRFQELELSSLSSSARTDPVNNKSSRLLAFVDALTVSSEPSLYEKRYASDLRKSLNALGAQHHDQLPESSLTNDALAAYREQCSDYVRYIYEKLVGSIESLPSSTAERSMQHWPRVSPILILQQLAHYHSHDLPRAWKQCIVEFGVALTALQRAERLVQLKENAQPTDLLNELRNSGHTNWNPYDHPESLLMEIESGIMIREVQEQIACEMRNPSSGRNSVMQLNMGEGKSTVIIPMVAASLANGTQLVRVIVAKPQSKQMAQMLISKLGGVVGRRVCFMPFSRSLKIDVPAAKAIFRMVNDCMRTGGVLLVQPEHILSFQLIAPECFIKGNETIGQSLMATQDFFDQNSRDVVDESDENFSVRFELIYTMGTQQTIDLSPSRWYLIQQILAIVNGLAPDIRKALPSSIEIHQNCPGTFARVRLLRGDAEKLLVSQVAARILQHGLEEFPVSRQTKITRNAILEYISKLEPTRDCVSLVEKCDFWQTCKSQILLLRGMLASGVLVFALSQKRWRVNYGLASRLPPTKLAVPYRAKDNPSPRSEFSHPDVVIALTSLCYYYGGLSDEDMFIAFDHLFGSDQADAEYHTWVKDMPQVPDAFKHLQGINLKDKLQCILKLFPHLRKGKAVVDYFLSRIVFPKEMKEFPHKLSASGWDIGKKKYLVTTGFSGTNDSRNLLPLHVHQLELPEQRHTNALVFEYLLQPINGIELMPPVEGGVRDAEHLLSTVLNLQPPVQVILDVGAQILEYDNLDLAKEWLRLDNSGKEAVVFVNDSDELCVVDRRGRVDQLQTSPFASRLDICLAFLDESHTRGIDLRLPSDYRAAVTLGAHLTRDRLVQACMRMRKLGKGQSVVFCVSPEIQSKIRENKAFKAGSSINTADVLHWSISETHTETSRSMPLWAVQGERFLRQEKIWQSMNDGDDTSLTTLGTTALLEEEAQNLDHRYRPRDREDQVARLSSSADVDMEKIANRCRLFRNLRFNASSLQEEQERELSPEIEQEPQFEKIPPAVPADHYLHSDVKLFANTGEIKLNTLAYMPAFDSLKYTSAAGEIALSQLNGNRKLLATADFATTIKRENVSFQSDAFQKHVHWVLTRRLSGSSSNVDYAMIISEYEANQLLPLMKDSKRVTLHSYKARCNAAYNALDKLDLFALSANPTPHAVPRPLSMQLSLFAGQLYISSYADYLEICNFLGICTTNESEQQGWKVGTDGFILGDAQGKAGGASGLTKSPMSFFKVLMSRIRRNGDGISKTDMGRLLEGTTYEKSDWKN